MFYTVTAFSDNIQGGNLAGVVLNAADYTCKEMLNLAKKYNFSEIAFLLESNFADFKIRYFTPLVEIAMCGHATVAAFNLLRDLKIIKAATYTLETQASLLKIIVTNKEIFMEQNLPEYSYLIKSEDIKGCFQGDIDYLVDDLPIQIVSTGLRDIILPVKDYARLVELKPNFNVIKRISEQFDVVGIHAFSLITDGKEDIQARNFAPLYGIEEEAATGTASGALASYLKKYLKDQFKNQFIIKQGSNLKRPSQIKVKLKTTEGSITKLFVGGKAFLVSQESIRSDYLGR